MKKWNKRLILTLVLTLTLSVLTGCSQKYDFAPNKAPDGISQKVYDDAMTIIADAMTLQDKREESVVKAKEDEDYNVHEWTEDLKGDLFMHELEVKYRENEDSLSEEESMIVGDAGYLYSQIIFYYTDIDMGSNMEKTNSNIEGIETTIKYLKEVIDLDVTVEDFIKY